MMKRLWAKVPERVQRFLLERVLLGLAVWLLAVVMVICAAVVAVIAMLCAILNPLRACDIIKEFGEAVAE